ncbi:MAG: MFS transporter [bacterium]
MRIWHHGIDGVHAFYINGLLRSLFVSLTTIFVPLFLYTMGINLWGTFAKAIFLVIGFYVSERLVVTCLVFPLSRLIEKIGFRKSISLSTILLMGYTGALMMASQNIYWLWVAVICGGIQIPMYWISRDSAMSQDIDKKSMGTKMGYAVVLENIAGLLGPFAGGAIVAIFGYSSLFVVALAILVLSAIPLWWMPPHSHHNGVSLRGFWSFLTNGRYLHQVVANFGTAMNDYGNVVIWPLILFFQGIKNEKLGAIYSIVAIVTIVVQYLTAKWFDKLRAKNDYADEGVYAVSSVGIAFAWLARMFVQGIGQVIPVDIGRQLFGAVHANFYCDYLHLGGKRMGSIAFWVYLEIVYSLGSIFIFGVMAIGIYFGVWKEMVLSTIALWSLVTVVIARESNMR